MVQFKKCPLACSFIRVRNQHTAQIAKLRYYWVKKYGCLRHENCGPVQQSPHI